jgi:hypothetical protein
LLISTVLVAVKNNYKILFLKKESDYAYSKSIFVIKLFNFIEEYNKKFPEDLNEEKIIVSEGRYYFEKIIGNTINIKSDYVTAFKEYVFTQKFKDNFHELAKKRGYSIPYDTEKTILVHLRLDDRANVFIKSPEIESAKFRDIINEDNINYVLPCWEGQSAIIESKIQTVINSALNTYKDYEVIIITNGTHSLPYKTINNTDVSYDLFLLSNSKVLIGSMSSFSFSAILFGNHSYVYYPLWDHIPCFGLTTKYDKTTNIEIFSPSDTNQPTRVSRVVWAAAADSLDGNVKCARKTCNYLIHTNNNNNGGKYCCRACKSNGDHGRACEKKYI